MSSFSFTLFSDSESTDDEGGDQLDTKGDSGDVEGQTAPTSNSCASNFCFSLGWKSDLDFKEKTLNTIGVAHALVPRAFTAENRLSTGEKWANL